jgi:SHS2 domain-containing protein
MRAPKQAPFTSSANNMRTANDVWRDVKLDNATRWEHFPHDADVGVRGFGRSPEQAFEQAALALAAVVTDPARVAAERPVDVDCEAPDLETLLVDWLNALIYEMVTRGMCFSRFKVRIDGDHLHGRAWGEPVDPDRHDAAVEPKGATFTALRVARREDGVWLAQCVVDV